MRVREKRASFVRKHMCICLREVQSLRTPLPVGLRGGSRRPAQRLITLGWGCLFSLRRRPKRGRWGSRWAVGLRRREEASGRHLHPPCQGRRRRRQLETRPQQRRSKRSIRRGGHRPHPCSSRRWRLQPAPTRAVAEALGARSAGAARRGGSRYRCLRWSVNDGLCRRGRRRPGKKL